jgi:ATPase subunit of ABC transporter with duplicated ATPase domains
LITHLATFANERLVERIKVMAGDPMTDKGVKRKLLLVLASLHSQFKDDPRMQLVAGLYEACGGGRKRKTANAAEQAYAAEQKRLEEEKARRNEEKEKSKKAKEDKARAKEEKKKKKHASEQQGKPRVPFDLEKEKPKIMDAVATATQYTQRYAVGLFVPGFS